MAKDGLNKKVEYGLLAAFYSPLLTERQQALIQMYCDEDLSLSEIAGQLSISRQAVSEHLNRTYDKLDGLESHLKLYNQYKALRQNAAKCLDLLRTVKATPDTADSLHRAMALLRRDMDGSIDDGI